MAKTVYENCALFPTQFPTQLTECCALSRKLWKNIAFYAHFTYKDVKRFLNGLAHELVIGQKLIQLAKLIQLLSNKSKAEKCLRDQNFEAIG